MIANMLLFQSSIKPPLYHSQKHISTPQNRSSKCGRMRFISMCSMSASSPMCESPQIPKHVALIIDGHRRWSRERGVPLQHGYHQGIMVKLRQVILSSLRVGIQVLTVFLFNPNNWSRPKEEVECMMSNFEALIQYQISELIKGYNLRMSVIGDRSRLPKSLQSAIISAEASSKANKGIHLVLALNYGGRYEITEAVKKISRKIEQETMRAEDIDESMVDQHLELSELTETPNPDLFIRAGGESRISDFLLWQMPYTELYFCDQPFPDFEESDMIEALEHYKRKERRFGK